MLKLCVGVFGDGAFSEYLGLDNAIEVGPKSDRVSGHIEKILKSLLKTLPINPIIFPHAQRIAYCGMGAALPMREEVSG